MFTTWYVVITLSLYCKHFTALCNSYHHVRGDRTIRVPFTIYCSINIEQQLVIEQSVHRLLFTAPCNIEQHVIGD